jgi:hypothetical protein
LEGGNHRGRATIAKAKFRKCITAGLREGDKPGTTSTHVMLDKFSVTTSLQLFNLTWAGPAFSILLASNSKKKSLNTNAMKHSTGENLD